MFRCGFGLACLLFARGAESCGHTGLLSRRPRGVGQQRLGGSILQKACLWKFCCRLFCADAIVGACLGRRQTKHKHWQCAGVFQEASCGDGNLPLARNRTAPAKRPAWPHRPVCGTLSQNGYGTCCPHPCDCILLESGNQSIPVHFRHHISSAMTHGDHDLLARQDKHICSENTQPWNINSQHHGQAKQKMCWVRIMQQQEPGEEDFSERWWVGLVLGRGFNPRGMETCRGSIPPSPRFCVGQYCLEQKVLSGVAQWLACWAHNPKVRGSKPRSAIDFLSCKIKNEPKTLSVGSGHNVSNAPDLFRTPKLSGTGPG